MLADPLIAAFPEIQRFTTIGAGIILSHFADVPVFQGSDALVLGRELDTTTYDISTGMAF